MIRRKQVNIILTNDSKVWKNIENEKIAIDIHSSQLNSDDEYFYIETSKKLFNIFNSEKLTKIPGWWN